MNLVSSCHIIFQDHPDVLDSVNLLAESVSKLFAAATAVSAMFETFV